MSTTRKRPRELQEEEEEEEVQTIPGEVLPRSPKTRRVEQEQGVDAEEVDEEDAGPGRVVCRILIPGSIVGRIIGKGGETIVSIRESTGTSIFVDREPIGNERLVTLRGSASQVGQAFDLIWAIVQEKEADDAKADPFIALTPDKKALQLQTLRMVIPASRAGGLIGKGGEDIKVLRAETEANINVQSNRDAAENSTNRIVTIAGQPEAIRKARHIITSRVSGPAHREGRSGEHDVGLLDLDGQVDLPEGASLLVAQFSVPRRLLGRIIGRGGESIMELRRQSGCNIRIEEEEGPHAEELPPGVGPRDRVLTVQGAEANVHRAQAMLTARVAGEYIAEAQSRAGR